MGQLVVVRHGQASLMKADYDELSESGRVQATMLGRYLAEQGWSFDAVFTGPARRHLDTAALTADAMREQGRPLPAASEIPQLDEHDAFALVSAAGSELSGVPEIAEGRRALASAQSAAERSGSFQRLFEAVMHRWFEGTFEPAGIETWPEFRGRVQAALEVILASGARRTLAFSSVGPLAVLLQRALGTDDPASFRTAWRLRNASMTTFVFDGAGRFTLDGFNALPHLPDPRMWTYR